jgi:hypothetical protein
MDGIKWQDDGKKLNVNNQAIDSSTVIKVEVPIWLRSS